MPEPIDTHIEEDRAETAGALIPKPEQQIVTQEKALSFLDIAMLAVGPQNAVEYVSEVIETYRTASIKMTQPEDWLLFRAVDKQSGAELITGYLQDKGCQRIAPLWEIEVFNFNPQKPEKLQGKKPDEYTYEQTADGYCARSKIKLEAVLGSRSSTEDIVQQWRNEGKMTDDAIEAKIKKLCRANVAGNIVRSLTGLNSVPKRELEEAWKGTKKNIAQCPLGRGWRDKPGPGAEGVPTPPCPKCKGKMRYNPTGNWGPWYSCVKRPKCKGSYSESAGKAILAEMEAPGEEPKKENVIQLERDALIKTLDAIQRDPAAAEIKNADGQTMKEHIGLLIFDDMEFDEILGVAGKLRKALELYKKGPESEGQLF